jgi:hypothetical protein
VRRQNIQIHTDENCKLGAPDLHDVLLKVINVGIGRRLVESDEQRLAVVEGDGGGVASQAGDPAHALGHTLFLHNREVTGFFGVVKVSASAKLNRNRVPFVCIRLSQQGVDVSAHRHHSNGVGVNLAENGAKGADATGLSQTASALVNDGSLSNNGANLALDVFDLFVGDWVGIGEIEPELGSSDLASLLVAVRPNMCAKGEIEDLTVLSAPKNKRLLLQQQRQ